MSINVNRESKLFKELNDYEIKKIMCSTFNKNTRIIEKRLMKGGLFNTTYYISIEHPQKEVICRLAPEDDSDLYQFEKNMMSHEEEIYSTLVENNIPVPNFIKYDNSKNDINREYTITDYVRSVPLNDIKDISEKQQKDLIKKIGSITRDIHNIKSDYYGFPCLQKYTKYESWNDFILSYLDEILERADNYCLLSQKELSRIQSVYFKNRELFMKIDNGALLHCDLWGGNILIKQESDSFNVAAIIDIDRAIYGDIDFEFSTPWMISSEFMEGYGTPLKSDERSVLKRKLYYLLIQLMSSDVWLTQYCNNEKHERIKNEALKVLDEVYKETA